MSTVFASITTPGPAGPPGRTALWLTGTVAPVTAQGLDGDMYLNDTNGDVYGPKNVTWGGVVANIQGVPGGPGPAGPIGYSPLYIVAPGVPSNATGNNGDMYLNNTTSDLYGPKTAGAWGGIVANIRGTQGPPGVAYTPRGAWNSATTYVQGDMVSDGNIVYIALQSANLNHVPLTSPTWWQAAAQGSSQWVTIGSDIYYNTGKVGIGTSSPQSILHVGQAVSGGVGPIIRLENSCGAANDAASIQMWDGVLRSVLKFAVTSGPWGADMVYLGGADGTVEVFRATSAGNVGIGTSTPTTLLHLVSASISESRVETTGAAQYAMLALKAPSIQYEWAVSGASTGTPNACYLFDRTGGAFRILVTSGGLVGIGTAAPQSLLHLVGGATGQVGPIIRAEGQGGSGAGAALVLNTGPYAPTYPDNCRIRSADSGDYGAHIVFENKTPGTPTNALAERMRINAAGNVGIGTSAPRAKLTVIPSVTPSTVATCNQLAIGEANDNSSYGLNVGFGLFSGVYLGCIQVNNGTSIGTLLLNPSGGNVGIGTAAPSSQLSIIPAGTVTTVAQAQTLTIGESSNNPGWRLSLGYVNNGANWRGCIQATETGVAGGLLLNPSGGAVGVGLMAPVYALDVTGDVNCTGAFRVNGTPIVSGGGVTVRSTVIGGGITRAVGTVYRNTFGKPLMITVAVLIIAGATYTLNTDATTAPTTVAASSSGNAGAACPCLTCWVLPNHYYTASVSSGATTLYSWNEWY